MKLIQAALKPLLNSFSKGLENKILIDYWSSASATFKAKRNKSTFHAVKLYRKSISRCYLIAFFKNVHFYSLTLTRIALNSVTWRKVNVTEERHSKIYHISLKYVNWQLYQGKSNINRIFVPKRLRLVRLGPCF